MNTMQNSQSTTKTRWLKKITAGFLIAGLILPINSLVSGPGGQALVQAQTLPETEQVVQASKKITVYQKEEGKVKSENRLVLRLVPGTDPFALAAKAGAQVERTGPFDFATLAFPDEALLTGGKETLLKDPGVISAELSQTHKTAELKTTSLPSVSDSYYKEQWALKQIDAPKAWGEGASGKGITVAVTDTGVDLNHPDLKNNLVPGYNAITGKEGLAAATDDNGHGTNVSGIIASALDGRGIVGVAYEAKIMPIKTMDQEGEGTDDIIASGIVWAVDNGANIINMSLGSDSQTAVLTEAIRYATGRGVLVIASSGNRGRDAASPSGISFPGADPEVLAVSATDYEDTITSFSLIGPDVALAAPGYDILTTDWNEGEPGYAYADGTSMAAPFAAGAAALVWSKYPKLKARDVRILLERSSKDLGKEGRDSSYGYGRINPYWALKFAEEPQELTSPAVVKWSGGIVRSASVNGGAQLTIPAKTFSTSESDQVSVSIAETPNPQDFPGGILQGSPSFLIQWGEAPPKRLVSLTIDGEIPTNLTSPSAYIYRWSGSRWLRVGGGLPEDKATVGIYQPGIYRLGFEELQEIPRLAGEDRIQTAIKVAKEGFPTGADTLILARADAFPDALAGATLGYKYQAPILLTSPAVLAAETFNTINEMKPKRILLLGGPEAIADSIEARLWALAEVKRIGGVDRYDTAAKIAEELGTSDRAVIVNGLNFPDALAIASAAAVQGMPILLTSKDKLATRTSEVLRKKAVTETVIVGGTGVISEGTKALLPDPRRLGGSDRYATAAEVLKAFPPAGRVVYLATGANFPDALTGGVLAAVQSTGILLVPGTNPVTMDSTLVESWEGKSIRALGGENAVSLKVLEEVRSQVNPGEAEVISVS